MFTGVVSGWTPLHQVLPDYGNDGPKRHQDMDFMFRPSIYPGQPFFKVPISDTQMVWGGDRDFSHLSLK